MDEEEEYDSLSITSDYLSFFSCSEYGIGEEEGGREKRGGGGE
jgi:hypothetical protein